MASHFFHKPYSFVDKQMRVNMQELLGLYICFIPYNILPHNFTWEPGVLIWYDIYLTAIGLTPSGSITRHIYKQTIHKIHSEGKLGSAGCAPSCRVIPWHLPYNWGKSTEKTSVRVAQYQKHWTKTLQEQRTAPYKNRSTLQDMNQHNTSTRTMTFNTLPNKSITTTTKNTEYATKLRIHNWQKCPLQVCIPCVN